MRVLIPILLGALLCSAGCTQKTASPTAAAAATPVHSKAGLVLEHGTIQPNQPSRIGIRFQTDKDWHIYWQNPGDSGETPRVKWQLPEGIQIGELEWPTPRRLTNPAGT